MHVDIQEFTQKGCQQNHSLHHDFHVPAVDCPSGTFIHIHFFFTAEPPSDSLGLSGEIKRDTSFRQSLTPFRTMQEGFFGKLTPVLYFNNKPLPINLANKALYGANMVVGDALLVCGILLH